MNDNQTVKVTLVAVAAPLVKGMGEASGAATKLGKDLDGAGAKAKGMESGLAGASVAMKGLAVSAGALAGAEVVAFLRDSVKAAGDLEQSVGGVDSVFKDASGTIHKFGKDSAEAVGLSTNEFNKLATVTGALLKNSGIKDFSNETLRLTERAADVSATFGGTAKDAVEAFNSALKGEYDPIERYGVKLNEAVVNAALAAKGLDGLKGAALEQAKAQERVNLIMAQSADSAGKFASEAGTLQGQQQRLNAEWENAKAALGQALLPGLTKGVELMRDGVNAATSMALAFMDLKPREPHGPGLHSCPPRSVLDPRPHPDADLAWRDRRGGESTLKVRPAYAEAMKPVLALASVLIVTGCGGGTAPTSSSHSVKATTQPHPSVTIAKPSITLAKDNWTDRLVISNLNKSWSANIIRVAYESDWNKFTVTSTLPDAHLAAEVCGALKSMVEQDGTEEPAITILGEHDRPLAVFRSGDTACATP